MTTRRTFMAGLLGTAATGAAQACPAQPATVFDWWRDTLPRRRFKYSKVLLHNPGDPPLMVRWSDLGNPTAWVKAT